LLQTLPLTAKDLAFLRAVRRCSAAALENTLVLMEAREAWSNIGKKDDKPP
jgi:hypothetical protein